MGIVSQSAAELIDSIDSPRRRQGYMQLLGEPRGGINLKSASLQLLAAICRKSGM